MSDKGRGTVVSTTTTGASGGGSSVGAAASSSSSTGLASGGGASSSSAAATSGSASGVKFRHEEIISCISALDEVLAQFDDSSLPYITEFETSCGVVADPSTTTKGTTDETVVVVAQQQQQPSRHNNHNNNPQSVSNLVAVNDNSTIVLTDADPVSSHSSSSSSAAASTSLLVNGTSAGGGASRNSNTNNKLVDQNQNLDWNNIPSHRATNGREERERNNNNNNGSSNNHNNNNTNGSPLIHTSHMIQIPVVESTTTMSQSSSTAPISSTKQQPQSQRGGLIGSPYSQKYNSSSNNSSSKRNNGSTFHHSSSLSSQTSSPPVLATTITTTAPVLSNVAEMNGNGGNKVTSGGHHQNSSGDTGKSTNPKTGSNKGTAAAASSSPPTAVGGGTYSKGTSHEILIPKITSGYFSASRDSSISGGKGTITTSSHSSRASIMVPVIESEPDPSPTQQGIVAGNVAKIRSQLNMGIFQPSSSAPSLQQQQTHVPGEMGRDAITGNCDIAGASPRKQHANGKLLKGGIVPGNCGNSNGNNNINNNNGGVSSTYITVSEGKSSLGQSSSSGVSSAVATMIMMSNSGMKGQQSDDEQWNFPSEKNLPRSLRKTRKTCFLDEGDSKQPMGSSSSRAESPFCCSESSNNGGLMSSSSIDHNDHSGSGNYIGSNGNGHNNKSPRVMPRNKGMIIPAKCEIINNGDGNFSLAEVSSGSGSRQIWNGQPGANPSPPPHAREGRAGNNNSKKKIYEDVILASQQPYLDNSNKRAALPISIIAAQNCGNGGAAASSSSPSSTFTSSSGVSLSVTSGPNTFVGEEDTLFAGRKSSDVFHPPSKSSRRSHQNQNQGNPSKPRARQQIPSPGGTGIPSPKNHFTGGIAENQFVPLVYQSQVSCIPNQVTMSSHHSPMNSVEIGTEEEHHRDDQELDFEEEEYNLRGGQHEEYNDDDLDDDELGQISSANNSPIKTCHPDSLMRNKSSDTDFEETASDSKILEKARRAAGGAGGKRGHSKKHRNAKHFEVGPNGSLPNQSQMMRMMMMMKTSNGKNNSVGSASSSSRSSSSSGSVSVKSSSSSDNNCGDVFHENIVQDYPTNIFNVATGNAEDGTEDCAGAGGEEVDDGMILMVTCDDVGAAVDAGTSDPLNGSSGRSGEGVDNTDGRGRRTITTNGAVVVLRGRGGNGRGNLLHNQRHGLNAQQHNQNQPNATLDIDDGYLSMINRNEAPLLWPEEFIESETFSKAELKRLSVTLNDDEENDNTDVEYELVDGSSNLHSPRRKQCVGEDGKVVSISKSNFPVGNNRSSMSSSSNTSGSNNNEHHQPRRLGRRGERGMAATASTSAAGRSSTEKTDYFSDDSLELEGDEDLLLQSSQNGKVGKNEGVTVVRAATSFVIPFHTNGNEMQEILESQTRKDGKVKKSNSQVSRIPKPASSNGRRGSSGKNGSHSGNSSPTASTSPVRKPCSFFIPFSSESQEANLTVAGGGSDRKLSAGDASYVVAAGLAPNLSSSLRSTSLPSSRRNSSSTTTENTKQPVAWNIAATTAPADDVRKSRQTHQQPTNKASSNVDTTYVVTDSSTKNNQSSHQQKGASSSSSSSVTINNNKANNNIISTPPSHNSGVTVTTTATKLEQEGGPPEKVLIVESSNNDPSTFAATTTITCSSSSPNANSSAGGSGGDSLSKRHKFQKQQTFIVSPSSPLLSSSRGTPTTTSVGLGQRLIDPVEDPHNPSASSSTKLTHEKDADDKVVRGGDGSVLMGVNSNDKLTTTTTTQLDSSTLNPAVTATKTTTTTSSVSSINDSKMEFNHDHREKQKGEVCEEENQDLCEVLSVWEQLSESTNGKSSGGGGGTFKKNGSELNKTTSVFLSGESSGTTSKEQVVEIVSGTNATAAGKGMENTAKKIEVGEEADNQNKLEGHDSVSEELESVVKMFLKATEGLLDPDESGGQIGSDSLKCSMPLGEKPTKDIASDSSFFSAIPGACSDHRNRERDVVKLKDFSCDDDVVKRGANGSHLEDLSCSFDEMADKQPLMTSTPIVQPRARGGEKQEKRDEKGPKEDSSCDNKRLSFLLQSDPHEKDDDSIIEDFNEQPPTFIPDPPPSTSSSMLETGSVPTLQIVAPPHASVIVGDALHPSQQQQHILNGKVTLDLLTQRIQTRNCPSPVENMSVSQFLHNKKNIWAMYDRPYDEDVLPPSFPRGYASRSQENLIDAMTHERLTKSFSARGQSSTLPLNCRPPPVQRRTSTFRNMFNKFRKHKTTDTVIPEGPEIRDEEAQSITSRETGPSEGKKRGFFSRLFRRSRKH